MSMFRRKRTAKDFAEEIQAHIELEAEELQREGLSKDAAHWKARRNFGSVRAAQEKFYMHGRWIWLDKLLRDLRHGVRSLLESPGFTITAIVTLALGMG
ncbi:permease prefix domain 1-containing protein, partial [Terriglobus sp. YAF25]